MNKQPILHVQCPNPMKPAPVEVASSSSHSLHHSGPARKFRLDSLTVTPFTFWSPRADTDEESVHDSETPIDNLSNEEDVSLKVNEITHSMYRMVTPEVGDETLMESLVDDLNDKDEDFISPDEADRALRALMGGATNLDVAVDINPEDGNIEGFKEGYRLLDHQIIGKNWIRHHEDPSLKRMGGILADDMG
ncbi:hypothetical protein EV360DRAFT_90344 [Lentinula raphanica]|nr:hypothetical protein EV360DRAFT_90344 [Lentinula raphanica]